MSSWSTAALEDYLVRALPGFCGPLQVHAFSYGQSNPTFKLKSPTGSLVLRKQPSGKLAHSAHAIDREFTVLQALQGSAVPVPAVHLYCADRSVIGTPFYIMTFVEGRIFTDPALPHLSSKARHCVYAEAIKVLLAIHAVDIKSSGVQVLSSSGGRGFYPRQLRRLTSVAQQQAAAAGDIPNLLELSTELAAYCPPGIV